MNDGVSLRESWELCDPAEFRISRGKGNTEGAVSVYFQVFEDEDDLKIASQNDYDWPRRRTRPSPNSDYVNRNAGHKLFREIAGCSPNK